MKTAGLIALATLSLAGGFGTMAYAAAPPQDVAVISQTNYVRDGKVLSADRFLKADQYPGLHSTLLQMKSAHQVQPLIPGAPNYRQIQGENIHGVAQPTIEGIKAVLKQAGADPTGHGTAVWMNLREEPVVYIDGSPYNLRLNAHPFANLEAPGQNAEQTEAVDAQLKAEILQEAQKNGGSIQVKDESPDGQLIVRTVRVTPDNVQTLREVYTSLQREGYRVDLHRVPIADEKRPDDADFDALVAAVRAAPRDAAIILNCHAGKGRTTTGMVASSIVRHALFDTAPSDKPLWHNPSVKNDLREQAGYDPQQYRLLIRLTRILEKGPETKADADRIIDRYDDLVNLRESIKQANEKVAAASGDAAHQKAKQTTRDYVERYFAVVTFDRYVHEQAPQNFRLTYSQWKQQHPELQKIFETVQLAMGIAPAAPGGFAYA